MTDEDKFKAINAMLDDLSSDLNQRRNALSSEGGQKVVDTNPLGTISPGALRYLERWVIIAREVVWHE